jgi:hypothetical protein
VTRAVRPPVRPATRGGARGREGLGAGRRRPEGGAVTSDWQDAPGNTTTVCHRKSVEVGPHTLHGSCWRETEGAKLVQRGELMKSRWGDAQRLFFEERLSETVPLLDMRPDWRRHVLACWDRRLEKRLTRRSSLGRPGPYGVGRARGGASAADGLARTPLGPYPRSEVQVARNGESGATCTPPLRSSSASVYGATSSPAATLTPCQGERRPRSLAAVGR